MTPYKMIYTINMHTTVYQFEGLYIIMNSPKSIIMHEYHYIRYHFVRRSDCTYIFYHDPDIVSIQFTKVVLTGDISNDIKSEQMLRRGIGSQGGDELTFGCTEGQSNLYRKLWA